MTSDAKIGLLLGLVLIFIIAFVVNGLPNFRKDPGSNELTINMVERQLGLADRERQVSRRVINPSPQLQPPATPAHPVVAPNQDIRFVAPLPRAGADTNPSIVETAGLRQIPPVPAPNRQTLPATYTVQNNDMLPTIAKKFYGPEEGNRLVNIKRIYEANKQTLKSPDEVYVGQKLIIPPLPSTQTAANAPETTFVSRIFETVHSIGQRHLSTDQPQQQSSRYYVVKDKDNLWKIASAELGDAKRYTEIQKLNSDILENSNIIPVGLRLKLPVR